MRQAATRGSTRFRYVATRPRRDSASITTAASSTSAVTMYWAEAVNPTRPMPLSMRGDHDAAEHAVHGLAAAAEQAGAADHRRRHRVQHQRAAVDGGRDRLQPRGVDDAGDAGRERAQHERDRAHICDRRCRPGGRPRRCRRWRRCSGRTSCARAGTSRSTSTASTSSTTQGTPLIGTSTPRLVLQSSTSATPAASAPAILSSVTRGGRRHQPGLAALRLSRRHTIAAVDARPAPASGSSRRWG